MSKTIIQYFSIFIVSLMLIGLVPAKAAPADLKMTIKAGFGGYYKAQSWIPIQANFSLPEGNPDFEGILEASYTNFAINDDITYRRAVQLTAPSNRTIWMYVPSDSRSIGEVYLTLKNKAGKVISRQSSQLNSVPSNELLIGVMSDDTSAFNYLNGEQLSLPFNTGSAFFMPSRYAAPPTSVVAPSPRINIAHLAPNDLPSEGAGWDSLDVLAVSDLVNTDLASQSPLAKAASSWLSQGRLLFVAGDSGLRRSGNLSDFLGVKIAGNAYSSPLPDPMLSFVKGINPPSSLLLANVSLTPDAKPLLMAANKPLIAKRYFGLGTTLFVATEPKALAASTNLEMWRYLLKDYEPRYSYGTSQRQPLDNGYRANTSEITPNNKRVTVPSGWLIMFIIFAYILFLGPILYFGLRFSGKREKAWLIIPAIAVLMSLGFYVTGIVTGGDPLVISRLAVVTLGQTNEGTFAGSTVSMATLYSNSRVDFNLNTDGEVLTKPVNTNYNNYNNNGNSNQVYPLMQQGPNGGYGHVLMGLSDQRSYLLEHDNTVGVSGGIVAKLSLKNSVLSGTVENKTNQDWVDVNVWLNHRNQLYKIPSLKVGQIVTLEPANLVEDSVENLTNRISGLKNTTNTYSYNNNFWSNPSETHRYQQQRVLASLIGDDGEALPTFNDRAYLTAWRESTSGFPLSIEGRAASSVDLTLLFQPLTLQP